MASTVAFGRCTAGVSSGGGSGHGSRAMLVAVDQPEPGWRPGDTIYVDLPDGQSVRCRIVAVLDDGTIQVVPEHSVTIA